MVLHHDINRYDVIQKHRWLNVIRDMIDMHTNKQHKQFNK
jgi:hypothetical protein